MQSSTRAIALSAFVVALSEASTRNPLTESNIMQDFTTTKVDQVDYRILRELTRDGRASDVALGERVNLSSTAVARRRKLLEDRGFLTGYTADLDMVQLGFGTMVIVAIELSSQAEPMLIEFEEAVAGCPSISFCSFVSGDTDFIIFLHVRSFEDYDRVYRRELSILPHVAKIKSSFVMRKVLNRKVPPAVLDNPKVIPSSVTTQHSAAQLRKIPS